MITFLAELKQSFTDSMGYETMVFESLDQPLLDNTKYIMCTRFPNWNHRKVNVGEIGFLEVMEIVGGVTKWYDGNGMIPYKYSNIQFIKFVEQEKEEDEEFVMSSQARDDKS